MVATLPSTMRDEYRARFNRVIDHVQSNLAEPLDLSQLARIACFSPCHFHRLFRSWVGETLHQFVQRLRLERAAHQLQYNPRKNILEIALDCGFSDQAVFARAFKGFFGVSASEWRKRKISKTDHKNRKAGMESEQSVWEVAGPWPGKELPMLPIDVRIEDLPPMTVAYVRHIGPYKGNSALFEKLWGQLCQWAGPRGLIRPDAIFLSLYHDDPDLTEDSKLRLEIALTVPEGTPVEGGIGLKKLEGGRYAMARIDILPQQYEEAWQALMAGWLPDSGYQPDDGPAMEIYRNNPKTHPEGHHILDICLPVKPL